MRFELEAKIDMLGLKEVCKFTTRNMWIVKH